MDTQKALEMEGAALLKAVLAADRNLNRFVAVCKTAERRVLASGA